jgi:hypothetical protein
MQRLALVAVPLIVAVLTIALVGCREFNPQSCENSANAETPPCGMPPDGPPPIDSSCKDDSGCSATPDQPVCSLAGDKGVCVQCTPDKRAKCTTTMPICTNNKCAPCTRHSDCVESNVCKPDGSCALEAEVAYVDGGGTDQMMCSKMTPCTKIERAVMTGRPIVKVSGTVTERTTLDNKNALILAERSPSRSVAPVRSRSSISRSATCRPPRPRRVSPSRRWRTCE